MGGDGGLGKYGLTHGHKEFVYELGPHRPSVYVNLSSFPAEALAYH